MPHKGIYIEDDDKNISVTQALFSQEGFEIVPLPQLPLDVKDIYPLVLQQNADFLLIDHQLNKKVSYNGYEALQEIRRHDSTIYAVLLTTFKVEDFKAEFGLYDLEVNKDQLNDDHKLSEISEKIRRACVRATDADALAQAQESRKFAEESMAVLKQIHEKVTKKP